MKEACFWFEGISAPNFSASLPAAVDVVIVGGGVAGLSTALHLREAGKRVVVLERDRVGRGASGHTLGVLTTELSQRYFLREQEHGWGSFARVHDALSYALDALEETVSKKRLACEFVRCEEIVAAATPRVILHAREEFETRRRYDPRIEWQEGIACTRTYPFLRARSVMRVLDQATVQPYRLCLELARTASSLGVVIVEGAAYLSYSQKGDRLIVKTSQGTIEAADICFCVDAVAHELLTEVPSTTPLFQSMVATEPVPILPGWRKGEIVRDAYMLPDTARRAEGDRVVFQAGQTLRLPQSSDRPRAVMTARMAWADVFVFGFPEPTHVWSAPFSESFDALPVITQKELHVYVAGSYGAHGLLFGFLAGELLTRMITHHPHPYQDLFSMAHPHRAHARFSRRLSSFTHRLSTQWHMDRLLHRDEHERLRG